MSIVVLKKDEIILNKKAFIRANKANEHLAELIIRAVDQKPEGWEKTIKKAAESLRAFSIASNDIYGSE